MSVVLKSRQVKFRNTGGQLYHGVNAISEQKTVDVLNEIEEKGEEVLASIPSDYTGLQQEVTDLKGDLKSAITLGASSLDSSNYELGSLKTNGSTYEDTSYQYRVRSSAHEACPAGKVFVIAEGYRIAVHYYSSNSTNYSSSNSGWVTGMYTVLDSQPYIKIVIAKVTEDTSSTANVATYVSAITVYNSEIAYYTAINTTEIATLNTEVSDLDSRVEVLEGEEVSLENYWQTYLTSILSTLKSALYALGNHGDSLYFFTDYHYDRNADSTTGEQLYKILEWLQRKLPAGKIINGGDLLQLHASVDAALAELNTFYQNFHRFGHMYNVIGNHDSNHYNSDARLTDGQMYQDLFAGFDTENTAVLDPNMYYYFDNVTQKIRYIVLNTRGNYTQFSNDDDQQAWLIGTLNNTPSGYKIVVIPHWWYEVNSEDSSVTQISAHGTLIKEILDAYNNRTSGTWNDHAYDFTSAGGKVICVFTGHVHREYAETSTAGYPVIGFICDAYNGSAQLTTRELGTYTEHSLALVTINTTAKTITCTPIGAGTTRTFSYT